MFALIASMALSNSCLKCTLYIFILILTVSLTPSCAVFTSLNSQVRRLGYSSTYNRIATNLIGFNSDFLGESEMNLLVVSVKY